VLLACACPPGVRHIVDLGAGVGAVGLRAAQLEPAATVTLIEREPALVALAGANIAANGLSDRVSVTAADILARGFAAPGSHLAGAADVVLTNPPFAEPARVRASPDGARARAHVMGGALELWVKAGLACLAPRGRLVMIHRADCLQGLLAALEGRFGGIQLRFVHPRSDAPAHRLLLLAEKGTRAPLTVLPPLVLHDATGRFTPGAEALHRGSARLDWQETRRRRTGAGEGQHTRTRRQT